MNELKNKSKFLRDVWYLTKVIGSQKKRERLICC